MKALAALALAALLPGCVAAVVPVVAAGAIGKNKVEGPKRKKTPPPALAAAPATSRLTLLPAGTALPPPDGALTRPMAPSVTGWRALVRHVAAAMSGGAACAEGTTAVLIDAGVAGAAADERDAAIASLNALRTMGARVTFVSGDPAAARAALSGASMAEADTAIAAPGEVLAIARRGCVVASGGGRRGDFTGLAWFALPGASPVLAATEPKP